MRRRLGATARQLHGPAATLCCPPFRTPSRRDSGTTLEQAEAEMNNPGSITAAAAASSIGTAGTVPGAGRSHGRSLPGAGRWAGARGGSGGGMLERRLAPKSMRAQEAAAALLVAAEEDLKLALPQGRLAALVEDLAARSVEAGTLGLSFGPRARDRSGAREDFDVDELFEGGSDVDDDDGKSGARSSARPRSSGVLRTRGSRNERGVVEGSEDDEGSVLPEDEVVEDIYKGEEDELRPVAPDQVRAHGAHARVLGCTVGSRGAELSVGPATAGSSHILGCQSFCN